MSATNMKLFLLLGFSLLLHHEIEGITTHSVTGCSNGVVLNCSNTEMIHVERITFYNITDCNQAVTDLQVCGSPMTASDVGLIPLCNGKTICNEFIYYSYCPGSKVDYRCIPGNNVKDMCEEFIIDNGNRIFLSTPNFPSRPTFTDISPCRCSIRGSNITSIQILELILHTSNDGNKPRLEINYGDVTYITESFNVVVNKRLSTKSTTAEITLNHKGIDEQYLWLEVQGVGMRVHCNTNAKDVESSSPPSSSTTCPSQTPDITAHSQDKDTTINIILAVLWHLSIILICITAIIIIVLLRTKKIVCMKKKFEEGDTNLNCGPRSPLRGLDRTQSVSESAV